MLRPETLYVVEQRDGSVQYARTPDGIGCYWYDEDQREEAEGDVCDHDRQMTFESNDAFENYRNRNN